MTRIHFDFETRATADLKTCGVHVYAEHPETDVWCMAWCVNDQPIQIWKLGDPYPFKGYEDAIYIAHNASFEHAIWNLLLTPRYGWPPLRLSQTRCTMAMAYAMSLPGSLENAAAALGLEVRKDLEGRRVMMQMARPRRVEKNEIIWWDDPARLNRLHAYCIQDVQVERGLERRMLALTPEEQAIWELDQEVNNRGVMVDLQTINTAMEVVAVAKERLDDELRNLTGGQVRTSNQVAALTEWILKQGITVDGLAKADIVALLDQDNLPDNVRRALIIRREAAKSSTAKLKSMREGASNDGRVRGTMQYHGASTGRWAGRRLQPQNMPRGTMPFSDVENVIKIMGDSK